jgi:hypothetical protein
MTTVHAGSALAVGLALTDMNEADLWGRYLALGGSRTQPELGAYLRGEGAWTAAEHDMAAHALNEYTSDHGMDHPVSYSDEV